MLVDPSDVTVAVYDDNDVLVKNLLGPDACVVTAGYTSMIWDGTDESGQQTPAGDYSYEVTATSLYLMQILGKDSEPINVVTRTGSFYHAERCCNGVLGNVDESPDGLVTQSDMTVLIDHLFISLMPLSCPEAGDIDSDGIVSMGDMNAMIDHLFITLDPLPPCP